MSRPTLTILSGLAGAGKSTLARSIAAETDAVLICRDELRVSLVNLDDEELLTMVTMAVARQCLRSGRSAIVDAWNLDQWDRDLWTHVAQTTEAVLDWRYLNTPIDLCIERDSRRPHPVGSARILSAAREYGIAA